MGKKKLTKEVAANTKLNQSIKSRQSYNKEALTYADRSATGSEKLLKELMKNV
jgi:hypothetical protein